MYVFIVYVACESVLRVLLSTVVVVSMRDDACSAYAIWILHWQQQILYIVAQRLLQSPSMSGLQEQRGGRGT